MKVTDETLDTLVTHLENKKKVNCILVVTSKKTGEDNTYKITGNPYNSASYFLDISYESGYNVFTKCAYYFDETNYLYKYKDTNSSIIKGAFWLLDNLMKRNFDFILEKADISHTGTCMKCGRELTDAVSIKFGMGKTCRNKI